MLQTELSVIGRMLRLQRWVRIHPAYYLPPILLSLSSALFEGIGMGLLVPMMNGFLTQDFSFIKGIPVLGGVIAILPESLTRSDQSLFFTLAGLFVGSVLLKNVLRYLSGISMAYVAVRSMHYLRRNLFERYLTFGKLYFDRTNTGHDNAVLSQFAKNALRPLLMSDKYINAFFSVIGYLVVMSVISWQLTVFAIPLFFVLHFSVRRLVRRLHELSQSTTLNVSSLGKHSVEVLSSAPLVQAFNMEEKEGQRFKKLSEDSARFSFQIASIQQMIPSLQELITLFASLLLFGGMLYLMVRGKVGSPPSFIVYFYLVLNAAAKFGTASNFRGVLADAAGSIDEILRILDDRDKHFVPEGTEEFPGLQRAIEMKEVHFSYNDATTVLKGLSLTMPQGEMTALVGRTGAGKTTIINLLLRHYDCAPGTIFLDGRDIRSFTHRSLRARMAVVSQETFLLHESLRYNITYGIDGVSEEHLWDAVERSRLAPFVQSLPHGLDTLIGDRGVQLSGGEKQRVSIARALLKHADILILDEATSALDSRTELLIQEAIREAVQGKTAIVIAHRLSTIQNAHKIIVLEGGVAVEEGTLEELLERNGVFAGFWKAQKFS